MFNQHFQPQQQQQQHITHEQQNLNVRPSVITEQKHMNMQTMPNCNNLNTATGTILNIEKNLQFTATTEQLRQLRRPTRGDLN